MEFTRGKPVSLILAALAVLSGCKPFSDTTASGCAIANFASSSPLNIGPSQKDSAGNSWGQLAQSFVTYPSVTISHVDLEMITVLASGTLSIAGQSLQLGVFADSATTFSGNPAPTVPSTQALGIQVIDAGAVPTFPQFVTFTFATPIVLAANTPYWLILTSSLAQNATSYVAWLADSTNPFVSGFALFFNQSTNSFAALNVFGQTGANIDFVFRLGC